MKIAIVNDIHVGRCLEYEGKVRASSHLIEGILRSFLQEIVCNHSPDLLVNLGDLIRSEEEESDRTRYYRSLTHFQNLACPIIHAVGNHELKKMSLEDIEDMWQKSGFLQKSYGIKQMEDIVLIWIGLEVDSKDYKIRRLPKEQLNWLRSQLNHRRLPTLIFTHCAIDDHSVSGNFFYETVNGREKTAFFLENQGELQQIITEAENVIAVFQAHLHYFHTKLIAGIPYITCPAMGDNICGPGMQNNVPEIYTIIEIKKNHLITKVYSREYCFAGYEKNY